ncbi:MAG: hypothetical protein ACKO96_07085, partial [Flammeovirgaceae bacterium]
MHTALAAFTQTFFSPFDHFYATIFHLELDLCREDSKIVLMSSCKKGNNRWSVENLTTLIHNLILHGQIWGFGVLG